MHFFILLIMNYIICVSFGFHWFIFKELINVKKTKKKQKKQETVRNVLYLILGLRLLKLQRKLKSFYI